MASTDNEIEMAMHAESLLNIQKARFSTIAGIMSFSETHDNLLMWAHYGKDFQGYVFGFDPQDLPFAWREANPTFALRRVTYAKERPTLSLEEVVVDSPEGELLRKWFSTKADVWSYEKEWRIFKYLSNKDHVIPTETYPIHLVELDVKKLKCLILGPRSSKELKRAIRDICDENGIELFQHVKDATRYSLGTWDRQRMDYKEQTWKAAGMEDIGFKHGRSPAE
ncbi:MAG: DUF2971 domain-containing protein [bacterium]|nr:DUF2971 domain-containing protein [bacterium]